MQELAALLQEPLQPKYSHRYFTGQPSAALAPNAAANDPKEATDINPQAINQVSIQSVAYFHCILSSLMSVQEVCSQHFSS